jgi:hypothetical protein
MSDLFETFDFKTIVVLKYFDISIVDISKIDRRVTFHFDNSENKAKNTWLDFMNGKLSVEPLKFYNYQENIKSLVVELVKGDDIKSSY